MQITEQLVLPEDAVLVPVNQLHEEVRGQLMCGEGDYALSRPRSRTYARILDPQAAGLLELFRSPSTVVEAVISYSRARRLDPAETLEEAFPLIRDFLNSGLLVGAQSSERQGVEQSLRPGDLIDGFEVLDCFHLFSDSELYQVRNAAGRFAALKIARVQAGPEWLQAFAREKAILRRLDGTVNPKVVGEGEFEGRPYLLLEWLTGVHATTAAAELRRMRGGRTQLLRLCRDVLESFARLHAQGVVHADVQPLNVLVAGNGAVKIVDYGFARLADDGAAEEPPRAGVGFYFEPEYAAAFRAGANLPAASAAGEQYALAALVYLLLTGAHYLDFSLDKEEMLRQIEQDAPLPFARRGLAPWPTVEEALARALAKDPHERFPSVLEFARALAAENAAEAAETAPDVDEAAPERSSIRTNLVDDVLHRIGFSGEVFASGVKTAPTCSVKLGAAGIAYALYRLACARDDAALLSLADAWADKAASHAGGDDAFYNAKLDLTPESIGRISPYHTASGVHAVQALISHALGEPASLLAAVEAFVTASRGDCDNLDLTLGRSGTLLICSMLLDVAPGNESLTRLGGEAMRRLWDEVNTFAPVRDCRRFPCLGMAHGWAGVLYATMRWCRSSGSPPPKALRRRLEELSGCAEAVGRGARWKVYNRTRPAEQTYMSGWCNGSAGHVHLWTLAHETFGDEGYLGQAEQAAWNTWEEPRETNQLCCGLAGRAYALLNLHRHTGDPYWLWRARELAEDAAAAGLGRDEPPDSLYRGEVGVALLLAELSKPEQARMPFFEQEGWPRN